MIELERDRLYQQQVEIIVRASRRKLGLQILDILDSKGLNYDDPNMKVIIILLHKFEYCYI